jgi:hypothetical protein
MPGVVVTLEGPTGPGSGSLDESAHLRMRKHPGAGVTYLRIIFAPVQQIHHGTVLGPGLFWFQQPPNHFGRHRVPPSK